MPILKRIITCQGSIQLVTALSVMLHRDRIQQGSIQYQNYLVIYNLYAPENQDHDFAQFIQKMAEAVCEWSTIVYLKPDDLQAIRQNLVKTPPSQIYQSVHRRIGIDQADEIYLCRNWQFSNQLLMNAYQSAYRICYGDGIGLYFSEHSAVVRCPPDQVPKVFWLRQQARTLKHQLLQHLRLKTVLASIDFHIGYFLLPYSFGEVPPMPIVPLASSDLMTIFSRFTEFANDETLSELQASLGNASISILLTSNFSEGDRVSQQNEILAYQEFLLHTHLSSILIIKPHPRDSLEKIHQLKQALSDQYDQVFVLTSKQICFLPFEVLFIKLFAQSISDIRIFAFSSSCLSLKLLFNVPSYIGFGDCLVSQFFDPNYIEARCEHEQTLRHALESLSYECSSH